MTPSPQLKQFDDVSGRAADGAGELRLRDECRSLRWRVRVPSTARPELSVDSAQVSCHRRSSCAAGMGIHCAIGERLAEAAPRFVVVAVEQKRAFRLGRREDRQEGHRLLRRVVDRVHHALRDECDLPRLEPALLTVDPLLGDAFHDVDDFLPRRMVVELVTGAGPHPDAHQRQLFRIRQPRL